MRHSTSSFRVLTVLIDRQSSLVQGGVGAEGGQLVSCLSVALWALPTVRSAVMDLQVRPPITSS